MQDPVASTPGASASDGEEGLCLDFMEEPDEPIPASTIVPYTRRALGGCDQLKGPEIISVGLVHGHPLWGHILYPAAIAMSRFLELHSQQLLKSERKGKGKNVLELGAGGGLPGLVAALEGARQVVISDFPDPSLVNQIQTNIDLNIGELSKEDEIAVTKAAGFTWGKRPQDLLDCISTTNNERFDLILLSDLVFNHSQHAALLDSCLACLSSSTSTSPVALVPSSTSLLSIDISLPTLQTPAVLCFYSHHRPTPELIAADLGFIALAREKGWTVHKVWEDPKAGPAFPADGGDIDIRSTVHGWALTRDGQN